MPCPCADHDKIPLPKLPVDALQDALQNPQNWAEPLKKAVQRLKNNDGAIKRTLDHERAVIAYGQQTSTNDGTFQTCDSKAKDQPRCCVPLNPTPENGTPFTLPGQVEVVQGPLNAPAQVYIGVLCDNSTSGWACNRLVSGWLTHTRELRLQHQGWCHKCLDNERNKCRKRPDTVGKEDIGDQAPLDVTLDAGLPNDDSVASSDGRDGNADKKRRKNDGPGLDSRVQSPSAKCTDESVASSDGRDGNPDKKRRKDDGPGLQDSRAQSPSAKSTASGGDRPRSNLLTVSACRRVSGMELNRIKKLLFKLKLQGKPMLEPGELECTLLHPHEDGREMFEISIDEDLVMPPLAEITQDIRQSIERWVAVLQHILGEHFVIWGGFIMSIHLVISCTAEGSKRLLTAWKAGKLKVEGRPTTKVDVLSVQGISFMGTQPAINAAIDALKDGIPLGKESDGKIRLLCGHRGVLPGRLDEAPPATVHTTASDFIAGLSAADMLPESATPLNAFSFWRDDHGHVPTLTIGSPSPASVS